jgi:hypothetical protein
MWGGQSISQRPRPAAIDESGAKANQARVLTRFHLLPEPRPEAPAHGFESGLVVVAHVEEHRAAVVDDRLEVGAAERGGSGSSSSQTSLGVHNPAKLEGRQIAATAAVLYGQESE